MVVLRRRVRRPQWLSLPDWDRPGPRDSAGGGRLARVHPATRAAPAPSPSWSAGWQPASVDVDDLPGDVPGAVRGEEERRLGDLLGVNQALERVRRRPIGDRR